jgi:hypothetical protein
MYLGNGDPGKAIDYLNRILNADSTSNLRNDIQAYSRIMFLMAHYDEENYEIMPYLVSNIKNYVQKINQKDQLIQTSLEFFKKVVKLPLGERRQALKDFNNELMMIKGAAYEKRAFIYLDITSWVQSKLRGISLQHVVKETFQMQTQKF